MATNTEQFLAYLQTPGLTDAQIANEVNRLGVTAAQVSQLTGVPLALVESRLAAPTNTVGGIPAATTAATTAAPVSGGGATTPTFGTPQETALYNFLQTPGLSDSQIATEAIRLGLNSPQISNMTGVPVNLVESRLAPFRPAVVTPPVVTPPAVVTPPVVTPPAVVRPPVVTPPNNTNLATFSNWLNSTPGLTNTQIAAEANRLFITPGQIANLTGIPETEVQSRFNATAPFSNATQGFAQNFNNYTSIPIGGQYNPNVVGGTGSPYSQIMGQMRPVGNPYAGVVGNLSMGGYDPALYERIAAANAAAKAAAAANLASGNPLITGAGGSGVTGPSQESINDAVAAANAAAAVTGESVSVSGETGESVSGNYNKGGMVDGLFGMNPPGPDDGAGYLDRGEYVIKKSAVNKYGRGLLDMINEGKVPAKKMKSLLG